MGDPAERWTPLLMAHDQLPGLVQLTDTNQIPQKEEGNGGSDGDTGVGVWDFGCPEMNTAPIEVRFWNAEKDRIAIRVAKELQQASTDQLMEELADRPTEELTQRRR